MKQGEGRVIFKGPNEGKYRDGGGSICSVKQGEGRPIFAGP